MTLPLDDRIGVDAAVRAAIERRLSGVGTLGDLVPRGAQVIDVVIQDEFTHDVVVAHAADVFLVFDST